MAAKKTTSKKEALALVAKQDNNYAPIQFVYTEKDAMKLAVNFSKKYGFDIERGDLMIYNQNGSLKPYITDQGCSKLQEIQQIKVEMKILQMEYRERPYSALVEAHAWKINEEGKIGAEITVNHWCDSNENGKQNKPFSQILSMAQTRAKNKAIKALTQLPTVFEEFSEDDPQNFESVDAVDYIDIDTTNPFEDE